MNKKRTICPPPTAGDLSSIVAPDVSKELLAKMIDMARDVMSAESGEE